MAELQGHEDRLEISADSRVFVRSRAEGLHGRSRVGGSAPSLCQRARGYQSRPWDLFRWIQAYAPELEKRIRPHLRPCNGSWRVDETYVKVKGRWTYLYRAVDSRGQTIDFLLSAKRDAAAAKRFFRKALGQPHTVNPRTITVDKNAAYPAAVTAM